VTPVPPGRSAADDPHFFEAFADFMGPAYLRYSFTKGTQNEVEFLWGALSLEPGMRLLDVGCGPGRHALAFAERGVEVVGIDIAQTFVDLGNEAAQQQSLNATFLVGDARQLSGDPLFSEKFDAVVSLCQGGFGLVGRTKDGAADSIVLDGMSASLKPGGRIALSAFSAYFQLQHLESTDSFSAATGVNTELTEIRNGDGDRQPMELHTTCFTPLELRLLAERSRLRVDDLWSVTPGDYGEYDLAISRPEFLLLATRQ
jgi:SAM-dependent methyltransferase